MLKQNCFYKLESETRLPSQLPKTLAMFLGGGAVITWLCMIVGASGATLSSHYPTNGPASGGTIITITGDGFILSGRSRSKCRFEAGALASVLGPTSVVHNSTHLVCTMPNVTSLFSMPLSLAGESIRLTVTAGSGKLSNHINFLVYDQSSFRITHISPNHALTNSSTSLVIIQGHRFLNTGEITCALESDPSIVTLASFNDSTMLQCMFPAVSVPSRLALIVSLNGQLVGAIPASPGVLTVTFYSTPPLVTSSYFGSSYIDVILHFDREVEIGPEEMLSTRQEIQVATSSDLLLDCEQVLDAESLLLVGKNASCAWQNTQQRAIIVQLSSDSNVTIGSIMRLNGEFIRTRYVSYSRLATGAVMVESIFGIELTPSPILEVPYSIPACGDFVISGDKSLYGGYRDLVYEWKVGLELDEAGNVILEPTLQDSIPMGYTSHDQLHFQAVAFQGSRDESGSGSSGDLLQVTTTTTHYSFQLTVRNEIFGSISSVVVYNLTGSRLLPLLTVGGRERSVRVWRDVLIEGKVMGEGWACGGEYQVLGYSWTLENSEGGTVNLDETRTNTSVLLLPPHMLQPGSTYEATLTVTLSRLEVSTATTSVVLNGEEELLARIEGGTRRSVGVPDEITLDGSSSVIHACPTAQLVVSWNCTTTSVPEVTERNASSCGSFDGGNNLTLSVPAGSLLPGGYIYTLSLSVTDEYRNTTSLQSFTSQLVVVFPNLVPSIGIVIKSGSSFHSVLVHEKFALEAEVRTATEGMLHWTIEYVEGECYSGL